MPLVVTTSIINKKTYLMTFIAWAIIITDVIFGTFLDALGKPLNSSFGVILFITMSIAVFFAGLYALRDYMVALRKELEAPSFFNRLYKATPIFLYALLVISRPSSIDPDFQSSNSMASRHLSKIELIIHLYGFLVPQVTAIAIAETVAVAYFLRYFKDQIGRAIFWTIIILPPVLFLTGIFAPQLIKSTASEFVYMDPRFLMFRVIGTAGWVLADFVIAYAYILVAKNLRRQITSSRNMIINYLIVAAFSTILVSPTTNNWITNNSYPPFGAIQRAFLVLGSFLFSIGIYSVAMSVAQDAELRQLARKYAKEYALLGTLGNAQEKAEITRKLVKVIHQRADAMEKETSVESSMLDDNEVRHYLDLVIRETGGKKDDRTVGA